MKFTKYLFLFLSLLLVDSLNGQNLQSETTGPREDGNIEEQMYFLIQKSNNYQQYKVIEKAKMEVLKQNVLDTLSTMRTRLQESRMAVAERDNTIKSLNSRLEGLQNDLLTTNEDKDSITFLGAKMAKGGYKALMWLIIAGLGAALAFFLFRFRDNNVEAVRVKEDMENLQKEFEEHRKRSLEREQKAMRKLQDEINRKTGV